MNFLLLTQFIVASLFGVLFILIGQLIISHWENLLCFISGKKLSEEFKYELGYREIHKKIERIGKVFILIGVGKILFAAIGMSFGRVITQNFF